MELTEKKMVRQVDARILREALSKVYKLGCPSTIQKYIVTQLQVYAKAVAPYCECSDLGRNQEGKFRCLDCGKDCVGK